MLENVFRPLLVAIVLLAGTLLQACAPAENEPLDRETLEAKLKAVPDPERMDTYHHAMSREPHHVGTDAQRKTAEYYRDRLAEWGYDAKVYEYEVMIPYPRDRKVELIAPKKYELLLDEPPIEEDPDTFVTYDPIEGTMPAFNAYSPSGDVTGDLVYANFGRPADYDELDALGVDVKGKIVITRYGGTHRGIKPKVAAENGAVGCLIYSDPKEDGFIRGTVYPGGPWRPARAVQRGSVKDNARYPGDPTTPERPSKGDVERIPLEEAKSIAPIPVLPISYADAEPLLRALGGAEVPEDWQGGLPFPYHTGPGPARVHMKLDIDYALRPVRNVIGWLRGREEPDRWIMAGGHRDAWTFGGRDPLSGAVSLLETARAFGELAKTGWRPRRTLSFASWDGEDFGLLGSTEWVEEFKEDCAANGVLYINRESYEAGRFSISGSHSLVPFIYAVAQSVKDPGNPELSVYDVWKSTGRMAATGEPRVGALGSGSDYSAFIDFAGVSALNFGFNGPNGLYHSTYDTYAYFQKFGDPGYKYGVGVARLVAVMMLRMADAPVLPFDHRAYADQILQYLDELDEGFETAHLEAVREAAEAFGQAADQANTRARELTQSNAAASLDARSRLNAALMKVERDLTDSQGLPERPWFKHLIYAPGFYTGYAVKTVPGVREALEMGMMDRASEEAHRLEEALHRAARTLSSAVVDETP